MSPADAVEDDLVVPEPDGTLGALARQRQSVNPVQVVAVDDRRPIEEAGRHATRSSVRSSWRAGGGNHWPPVGRIRTPPESRITPTRFIGRKRGCVGATDRLT